MQIRAFVAALMLAAFAAVADARAIMGVDFGTEFMKVSLVKPGMPFQVIANFQSKRKTPTQLAFYSGERQFGSDAEALGGRKPSLVLSSPQILLGRNRTHPLTLQYMRSAYGNIMTNNSRGGIDLVIPGRGGLPKDIFAGAEGEDVGEDAVMSPEVLTAMLLAHARDFATDIAEIPVVDVVITVPAFYTQNERLAMLDAAELAGLKVIALVDENTGAGVQYGIDRIFDNATHHMLLYNMGARATQVTVFAYDAYTVVDKSFPSKNKTVGQGRVLAKSWDVQLGGAHIDAAIIQHVAEEINAQKKNKLPASANGDIRNVPAAMAKIRRSVVKTKEILSANEEYQMFVESVLPDVDFRITLSRKLLDSILEKSGINERITAVIDDALHQANLTMADLDIVEIVGGSVRIPRVQTVLKGHLGEVPLGQHLNGDDSMALGAAFSAANRSAAFRVRKVGMIDGLPFGVGVRLTHLPTSTESPVATEEASAEEGGKHWSKRSSLFRAYEKSDSVKRITLQSDRDMRVVLFYESNSAASAPLPAGTSKNIAAYNITGVSALVASPETSEHGTPKVHVSFELDQNGIVRLVKAEAVYEVSVQELVPPTKPPKIPVEDKNATTAGEAGIANDTATADADSDAEAAPAKGTETEPTASATPEPVYRTVKKALRFPLEVALNAEEISVRTLSAAEKRQAFSLLRGLTKLDDERRARDGAKNALEAYVYDVRDKLNSDDEALNKVSTDDQRGEIREVLMAAEDWLYDEGSHADMESYQKKLKELKDIIVPVMSRAEELRRRPKLLEDTKTFIETSRTIIASWAKKNPQITANETADATEMVQKFEDWFNKLAAEQKALAATETPVLKHELVVARMKVISDFLTKLARRPKPTPKPTPKTKAKAETKPEGAEEEAAEEGRGEDPEENTGEGEETAGEEGAQQQTPDNTESEESEDAKDEL